MIIPIHHPPSTSSRTTPLPPQLAKLSGGEVVLIEMQGIFEVVDGDRHGLHIGKLSFVNPEKPTLTVGHHLLEGKLANIAKPLAVLVRSNAPTRSPASATSSTDDADDAIMADGASNHEENKGANEAGSGGGNAVSYDIVTLVKRPASSGTATGVGTGSGVGKETGKKGTKSAPAGGNLPAMFGGGKTKT